MRPSPGEGQVILNTPGPGLHQAEGTFVLQAERRKAPMVSTYLLKNGRPR